ncbi:ras-like protein family member 10A isoform X1 [Dermochelys coriacea]|uniref:ras-like protein family member 10A isoform X1 n=1 Tax=Dermochelys coriacea TaxID=27794 RepID=UPI001CA9F5B5|nr:ras-like protein family member 10A isoform X1 [Dermochelys coriacea]
MVETLKVAVLGAPRVGKTAIIRQFLYNDFTDTYSPTGSRDIYRPSLIYNGNMYDMKIMDVPYLTAFPANSSQAAPPVVGWRLMGWLSCPPSPKQPALSLPQEWLDLKCHGLRNTNAYVLVYDICNPESFEYVKMIQQQIMENRAGGAREAPIIVVGNKRDQQKQRFMPRRTLSVLVKKSWKCGYMECSAKYNWHIVLLFKEMLSSALAWGCKHHSTMRPQGALHTTRCSLM